MRLRQRAEDGKYPSNTTAYLPVKCEAQQMYWQSVNMCTSSFE